MDGEALECADRGGVRATISGSGGIARISACTGAAKEVRLDVSGETADITCASTGTITVKAISAAMQIELREQLATGAWQQFNLRTGQSMSVGSPATAGPGNVDAIDVQLIQIDGAGLDTVVGSYQLRPGASVDVSASPRAPGRDGAGSIQGPAWQRVGDRGRQDAHAESRRGGDDADRTVEKMMKQTLAVLIIGVVTLADPPGAVQGQDTRQFVADEILIQFRQDTSAAERADARSWVGGARRRLLRRSATAELELASTGGWSVEDAAARLRGHPAVRYAEPNWIYTHQATSDDPYFVGGSLWGMLGDTTAPANQFGSRAGEAWQAENVGSASTVRWRD